MIKESIKVILGLSKHQKILDDYARSKCDDKFKESQWIRSEESYHDYSGFLIISETEIKIEYCYGYADMEYNSFFVVDVREDDREICIDEIFKK